jgi:oligopeptide transport system ATP-binding protein
MVTPATPTTQPLLRVRDLVVRFHGRQGAAEAVRGISFHVNRGETLGLVGESGCGKSVTALSIMGLLPRPPAELTGGRVEFEGTDLLKLRAREMSDVRGQDIAMVFQDPMTSLNPVLTVGRQLSETLRRHLGLSPRAAWARSAELLELVGIPVPGDRLDDYPHQFSGGMRQRVMIAMAISCHPKLLIADEPTTALDVTIQAQILDLLRRLADEFGMSMILITHDLGVVAGMADRVHVMYAGTIVERGITDDVFRQPRHPYTRGLLRSIPRIDRERPDRLLAIEGLPPTLVDPPPGCAFSPRCAFSIARCQIEAPPLERAGGGDAEVACWVDTIGDDPGRAPSNQGAAA